VNTLEGLVERKTANTQQLVKTNGEGGRLYWAISAENYKYLEDLTVARIVVDKPKGGLRVGHWHSESSELSLVLKVFPVETAARHLHPLTPSPKGKSTSNGTR